MCHIKSVVAAALLLFSFSVYAKQPIRHIVKDNGSGLVDVSGVIDLNDHASQKCIFDDYLRTTVDKTKGKLPVLVTPEVSGICTDASILLPKGWKPKEFTIRAGKGNDNLDECKIRNPSSAGGRCFTHRSTVQDNGRLGWVSPAPSKCTRTDYLCGEAPIYVDVNISKKTCEDIGTESRTVYTYLQAMLADESTKYNIRISLEACSSGGDFESN